MVEMAGSTLCLGDVSKVGQEGMEDKKQQEGERE